MRRLGGGDPDDIVGRHEELAALRSEFESAASGQPRLVLLHGVPGIGKSFLLRHFVRSVAPASAVTARADESETGLECGIAEQLVAAAGSVMPAFVDVSPSCDDPIHAGRQLLGVLSDLQEKGPVVLVVDDAHWADTASLRALTFALRRLQADRVLAIVAVRDVDTEIPEGLRRLADEGGRVIRLHGLSAQAAGKMAAAGGAGPLPRRALERLVDHTAGNPLYIRALVSELSAEALRRADPLPAPHSFALVVLAGMAPLSPGARHLVEAASVIGAVSDLGVVAQIAEMDDPGPAVDEVTKACLMELDETPSAAKLRFCHSMVRAAVYNNLGRARRSELHSRAAAILPGRESLHHSAEAALVADASLAAVLADAAADDAAAGNVIAAGRLLLRAARLTPDPGQRERHLYAAVEQLMAGGEVTEAAAVADQLAQLPDTPRRRAAFGSLAFLDGRQGEAERLLTSVWEEADPATEAPLRARAAEQLATLCALQIRPNEVLTWARRALLVGSADDSDSTALLMLVTYLAIVGRPGEALPLVDALPTDPSNPTRRDLAGILARGIVRMWMGQLPRAHTDLTWVLEASRSSLGTQTGLLCLGSLAQLAFLRGDWAASFAHADLAIAVAEGTGQPWVVAMLHAVGSWAPAAQGHWDEAEAQVAAAQEAAARLGDAAGQAYADEAELRLAVYRKQPERAVAAAQRLVCQAGRAAVDEPGVFFWRDFYAETLIQMRRLDEAATVIGELEALLATRPRRRLAHARAAHLRAELEAAQSHRAAARRAFESALSYEELASAPFERALVAAGFGRFLRHTGERREALAHLEEARETFSVLGANPALEAVNAEIVATGLAPRRRSSGVRSQLTPQEAAVAELAASGRTNRQVAEALTVTQKTVEYHLSNVFMKLGISSRRHLAVHLEEAGTGH